jgi:hypothetical protein
VWSMPVVLSAKGDRKYQQLPRIVRALSVCVMLVSIVCAGVDRVA